jgi:hypothetical protein
MTTSSSSNILQEAFILATGTAANDSMLAYLEGLVQQGGGGYGLVAQQIDAYMGAVEAAQGTAAAVEALALNGLGVVLGDGEALAIKAELAAGGVDTWSKIFAFCINLQGNTGLVLDNRAAAAQAFDVALELQGKVGLFAGATVDAAVKEMLQNIGSSDASLQNGIDGLDAIAGKLGAQGLQSAAVDGAVAGALVLVDADGNGRLTPGEYSTVTDSAGHFVIPAGIAPAVVLISGGTDLLTGEAFKGTLTAPAGSIVANPFTSMIVALTAGHIAGTVEQATLALQQALGLPSGINLLSYDPIAVLASGTASAAEMAVARAVEAKALELANVMTELTATIDAAKGNGSSSAAGVAAALASALWTNAASAAGAGTFDLTDVSTLTQIVEAAASAAGSASVATHATEVAEVIAASNLAAANATTTWDLVQAAVVSQGAVVNALAAAGASGQFDMVLADFTGTSLATLIHAAVPGYLAPGIPVPVGTSGATVAAATLNSLDAETTALVDASAATIVTGTAAEVAAAYASSGIAGLGNEAVILSDTTLAAALLNVIDSATSGLVDAAAATTLTGTAADVTTAYASVGITGLGNEMVTLSDAALTAAALNAVDAATSGTVNASAVSALSDTAANVTAAYASTGITGLGNEAVTLSDTTLAAATLDAIDGHTTGVINVGAATVLTGTAADVATAYASTGITGLGNEAVTLSDTALACAALNAIDTATTGLVDASAATTVMGTAAALSAAYASVGIAGLSGSEAVTLLDTTLAAATLNAVDAAISGVVNASSVTTLTGTAAELSTAYASAGITGLGNEALTLSDTSLTGATLNAIDALTSGTVDASSVTTVTGTVSAVEAAYASTGITGLGNEAVTLSDTNMNVVLLYFVDWFNTGVVDVSAATTLTGNSHTVADAYASSGITGLGNEAVVLLDDTAAASTLNTVDAATTGLVNATTVTTVTGTAADVNTAYASAGITGLGNEAVTLWDTTLTALNLNNVDADTSGVVNASSLTSLTGDFAGIALAMGSAGITTSASINLAMTDAAANLNTHSFAAGGAADTLNVGVAGAATDLTSLTGFETITLAGSTSTSADVVSIANGPGTVVHATGAVGVLLGAGGQTFTGSAGADNITGGSGADNITGGSGADDIAGGNGADTIIGGGGQDTIHLAAADSATDVVVIDSASNLNADTVLGFVSGQDVLDFSIGGLGLNGADYSAGAVTAITAATAAALGAASWSNYIVVDTAANIAVLVTTGATGAVLAVATDTGDISRDADGNFSAGAVIIGTATGASASGDFAIIA